MKMTPIGWTGEAVILACTIQAPFWLPVEKQTMKNVVMPVITYCAQIAIHNTINHLPHLHGAN